MHTKYAGVEKMFEGNPSIAWNATVRRKSSYTSHCVAIGITIKLASIIIIANQHCSESDHK